MQFSKLFCLLGLVFMVSACAGVKKEAKYPTGDRQVADQGDIYTEQQGIFGKDGLSILGDGDEENCEANIGVNGYLWRASLDTISFMPINSADPFGGVILTDWYTNPKTPNERYKLNVMILDKVLKASALKVSMFKQTRVTEFSDWKDIIVGAEDSRKIEDAILTRARQMRIKNPH